LSRMDVCCLSALALTAVAGGSAESELIGGKKALFGEDFELDIYEWTLMEEGEHKGEDLV